VSSLIAPPGAGALPIGNGAKKCTPGDIKTENGKKYVVRRERQVGPRHQLDQWCRCRHGRGPGRRQCLGAGRDDGYAIR
jgi:hypothetical protein